MENLLMAPMERAPTRRALMERALAMLREPMANLPMERALTAREPMENLLTANLRMAKDLTVNLLMENLLASLLMARALERDRKTARDQRVPRNGGCATAKRSWRHPNVTVSTIRPTPGPRLSVLPCPWVTSAVSAKLHHHPRERMER